MENMSKNLIKRQINSIAIAFTIILGFVNSASTQENPSWLDQAVTNWNQPNNNIPIAPQSQGKPFTTELCSEQIRSGNSSEDQAESMVSYKIETQGNQPASAR